MRRHRQSFDFLSPFISIATLKKKFLVPKYRKRRVGFAIAKPTTTLNRCLIIFAFT